MLSNGQTKVFIVRFYVNASSLRILNTVAPHKMLEVSHNGTKMFHKLVRLVVVVVRGNTVSTSLNSWTTVQHIYYRGVNVQWISIMGQKYERVKSGHYNSLKIKDLWCLDETFALWTATKQCCHQNPELVETCKQRIQYMLLNLLSAHHRLMCLSVCNLKYITIRQQTPNLYRKKSKYITAHIFDKFFKTCTSTTDK